MRMQKWLSLSLALLMVLFSCSALAEGTVTYTHSDPAYSISVPANWTVLSSETLDEVMAAGLEQLDNPNLASYADMVKQQGIVVIADETGIDNITIVCQTLGMELDAETLKSMMSATIKTQMEGQLGTEISFEDGIVTLENGSFYGVTLSYELQGIPVSQKQYYVSLGQELMVLTFTHMGSEIDEATATLWETVLGTVSM